MIEIMAWLFYKVLKIKIMKLIKRLAFVFVCAMIVFSCVPRPHAHGKHKVPQGHAKKMSGSKSARPHAPGQVKKVKHHKAPKPPKNHKHKR